MTPEQALARHYPGWKFRDEQLPAVRRLCDGRSTLCLMPTGGGKSLIYTIAGLVRGGVTLVVSPLISLMAQQARKLEEQGVRALNLGGVSGKQLHSRLREFDFETGPTFIFISPERLAFDGFVEFVARRNRHTFSLVAIDEIHCVSQWGHSFRPPYKGIPIFLDRVFGAEWPPVLGLSATVTPEDRADICEEFRVPADGVLASTNLLRTNLKLQCEHFEREDDKIARLREILAEHAGEKVLVYVHRKGRKDHGTEGLSARFRAEGVACGFFDADLSGGERDEVLESFQTGETPVVFATTAFGMGIDIPDIRVVVHYLLPESLEQYYQEVGRAGRDGRPSRGYLLYTETNMKVRRNLIKQGIPSRADLVEIYESKLKGIRPFMSFDPATDDMLTYSTWFALLELGVLRLHAKGPQRVDPFQPASGVVAPSIQELFTSRTGGVLSICRRLSSTPGEIIDRIYTAFDDGRLRLEGSPSKVAYYVDHGGFDEKVSGLASAFDARKDSRLAGFGLVEDMILGGADPHDTLSRHLAGIAGNNGGES
jgi:ATP-dependent DNA helicase RecQ